VDKCSRSDGLKLSLKPDPGDAVLYQWMKDGVAIPGATGSTYTKSSLSADDNGTYTCAATLGTVTIHPSATVALPDIDNYTPNSGGVGTLISFTGKNLGSGLTGVSIGGVAAAYQVSSDGKMLNVTVPKLTAGYQDIDLGYTSGDISYPQGFTYIAGAADHIVATGTCGAVQPLGDNDLWTLTDDGTLTISGKGAMFDYGRPDVAQPIRPSWESKYANQIKNVVVDNGVTTVGTCSFCSGYSSRTDLYKNMTTVSLCNGIYIMPKAFMSCPYLINVDVGDDSITSDMAFNHSFRLQKVAGQPVEIGRDAFSGGADLDQDYSTTSMSSIDLSKTTYIGDDAFLGNNSIMNVDLSKIGRAHV
jgi:hypothetical protein